MKQSWMNQFGPSYDVPSAITNRIKDISWGNDACPSFFVAGNIEDTDNMVRLWVEHPDEDSRELPCHRYLLVRLDNGVETVIYDGDDVETVLVWLDYFKREGF